MRKRNREVRDVSGLLQASQAYLSARATFLASLQLDERRFDDEKVDPLKLASEVLVAILFQGELAPRHDQPDFDVTTPEGQLIQVKYVLNTGEQHSFKREDGWNLYAVVLFRGGQIHMVVVFPNRDVTEVYQAFAHHSGTCPDPSRGFDLTEARFTQIGRETSRFEQLGLRVWKKEDLAQWTSSPLLL
jgi:hypothetical protein